nr:hypothetical protein [Bradyrhizobium ivorense]
MPAALAQTKCDQQLIELLAQSIDCALAKLQEGLLGCGSKPIAKPLANSLNDLQRLAKIMPRDREQRCFKLTVA